MLQKIIITTLFLFAGQSYALGDINTEMQREAERQTQQILNGAKSWPIVETQFFIIHYHPETPPEELARAQLDAFVVDTLCKLDPSESLQPQLETDKLEYYLCTDLMVQKLTGYPTKGMADLSGRAVISSHFPHFHELAHLLIDLLMSERPQQILPVVQEGSACLLGGRWGRSPDTILFTAWVQHNFSMGDLEDVLTYEGFHSNPQGTDVAYPLGAVLCDLVRREVGWSGVLELNRQLSGSPEIIRSLSKSQILEIIAGICGWENGDSAAKLQKKVDSLWAGYRRCGIEPATEANHQEFEMEIVSDTGSARLFSGEVAKTIEVNSRERLVFLLSPPTQNPGFSSQIFADHFPGKEYLGEHYGLRCEPDNISLYDYASNQLLATWVAGFTQEMGAMANGPQTLKFQVDAAFNDALDKLFDSGATVISIKIIPQPE